MAINLRFLLVEILSEKQDRDMILACHFCHQCVRKPTLLRVAFADYRATLKCKVNKYVVSELIWDLGLICGTNVIVLDF